MDYQDQSMPLYFSVSTDEPFDISIFLRTDYNDIQQANDLSLDYNPQYFPKREEDASMTPIF